MPEARSWITAYPEASLPLAEGVYPENILVSMREGITVLSQTCPHLGCRVPECATSQWFECQCHGSQYNRAGEHKAGPAPRGMGAGTPRAGQETERGVAWEGGTAPIPTNSRPRSPRAPAVDRRRHPERWGE